MPGARMSDRAGPVVLIGSLRATDRNLPLAARRVSFVANPSHRSSTAENSYLRPRGNLRLGLSCSRVT